MANSIKGFGEIKGIYDDIGIGIMEIGDSMEEWIRAAVVDAVGWKAN